MGVETSTQVDGKQRTAGVGYVSEELHFQGNREPLAG